ncbi:MAG TPA: DUF3631 domain-containing protein [Candidatus Binatia bacterium]|jgi:hypothetical protein|nr:DUF3631 domain-containing protein [Candidatus Binatia bacterium]
MNSINTHLQFFTDPRIIAKVNRSFVTRFLEGFADCLPPQAIDLLNSEHNYERFCAAAAAQFSNTSTLGPRLLQALLDIETLALPENAALLEDAISHLPSYFDLNPNFHPLHRSLHLWMIAERTPGVTWPLPAPTLSPPEFQQEVTELTENSPAKAVSNGQPPTQGNGSPKISENLHSALTTPHSGEGRGEGEAPTPQPATVETGEPSTPQNEPLPPVKNPEPTQATAPVASQPIENQNSKIQNSERGLPLPKGEGRGEGEARDQTSAPTPIQNRSLLPPFPPVKNPEPTQPTAPIPSRPIENQNSKIENPPPSVENSPESDFSRLARLSPVDYERVRKTEALRLKIRVRVLDSAVAKCRAELRVQDQVTDFRDIEPWPEPVNGAQLLAELSALSARRLYLPPGAPDAMALWVHLPHVLEAFHIVPRLSLYSIEPGCGKTTALDILTLLVPRPLRTESVSLPVIYHLVDERRVTLMLDETDTYLPRSDKHRGLFNSCHKRGARTYRCAEGGTIIRGFNAFAAAVLASLGPLPSTLRDRSIEILMQKAGPGQIAEPFDPLHTELETTLGRKLARWAKDNLEALKACKPAIPPGVFNRLADNWRPLFAVAQLAGGEWPARALDAFNKLTAEPPPARDPGLTLLSDIRQIFAQTGAQRLFSSALVELLNAIPDRPWSTSSTIQHPSSLPKPLTVVNLGRRLSTLGIASRNLRIGDEQAKGYDLADLNPAFAPSSINNTPGEK